MRAREAFDRHNQRVALRPLGLSPEQARVWESQVQALGFEGSLARLPVEVDENSDLTDGSGGIFFVFGASPWFGTDLML